LETEPLQAARYCQPIWRSDDDRAPAAALDELAMPMFLPRPGRPRVSRVPAQAGRTTLTWFGRFEIAA
jgi:hypothetical protein